MKKILITGLALILLSCSGTQNSPSTKTTKPLDVNSYINSITSEELKTSLTIVASDEMQGRETGSEGQKKAGQYLIGQYKKNGIPFPKGADSYYQKVPAAYLNEKRNENLPDSENIWAFI
jgi:hypothetical protein